MNTQTILNSDAFWLAVGFIVNTLATFIVAKVPPTGPIRKAIRALHGLLDKIDPPQVPPAAVGLFLAVGFAVTQPGCATLRSPSFWDTVHTGCEIAMAATPEAAAKAKAIGGTVGDVATIVCGVADVIEPFVKQEIAAKEGRRMATNATAEAVEIAKEKGLL